MNIEFGLLFKKRNVTFKNKNREILEFKDAVFGISFTDVNSKQHFNIVSGSFAGMNAIRLGDDNLNEEDVVAFLDFEGFARDMYKNDDCVDFSNIRERIFQLSPKYCLRNGRFKVKYIEDKSMLKFLEQQFHQNHQEFDEGIFERETDISSMYSSIKKTIVSQDEQIMQILTALFKNQKVVNSDLDIDLVAKLKENILICGPTGTGKTEILKRISKIYNVPIVIEDATSLSETGYHGRNITDMLEDLYLAANGNIELAEKGILVIDEFDKLAEKPEDNQSHVSRLGVQRSLLKLLDGSLFYFDDKQFNTSKLTVVGLGAFTGINNLGDNNLDDYKHLTLENFINYGIMRELIGRFSKTITMNPLSIDDIVKILTNSDFSPLNTYKKLFEMLEIKFDYTDEFVKWLALEASKLNSGARSLKTVFDNCISSAMFRIFAGEYSGISLVKPEANEKPYVLTKEKNKILKKK